MYIFQHERKYRQHGADSFFISPIVNMEKLITDMMALANVTEEKLKIKGVICTDFGEDLSWEFLCYVREQPNDDLTSYDTITDFAARYNAAFTDMENGERWFSYQRTNEISR